MNEVEKQFAEIINNAYNEIIEEIYIVRNNKRCPNCNGDYVDATCNYCMSENITLKGAIDKIESVLFKVELEIDKLHLSEIKSNKFFNGLFSISRCNISCVNDFLDKYDYGYELDTLIPPILTKIDNDDEISEEEMVFLETIIELDFDHVNYQLLYNYFIKRALIKKSNVSYGTFCYIIERFVELGIKNFYQTGHCYIIPYKEVEEERKKILGCAEYNDIFLAEEEIYNLYYNNETSLIRTIHHELAHCVQFKYVFPGKGFFTFHALKELKERILQVNNKKYYEENYHFISFELEAIKTSIDAEKDYLYNLGLGFEEDAELKVQKYKEEIIKRLDVEERTLNGLDTTVDQEFEKFIYDKVDIIRKYPALNQLYKIENDSVIRKSQEELINDYENLKKIYISNENALKLIEDFYSHCIQNKKLK